jgi:recombination protein RecT
MTAVAKQPQRTAKQNAILAFKKIVDSSYYQQQLKNVLKENSGVFATSLMEIFTGDSKLWSCDPKLLMAEAMKAASLKLPLSKQLGYAYLLVYSNTPTMVIGYKGLFQLAIRSGLYKTINAGVVYEGELRDYDKLTGEFSLNGEKISDKPVGYFSFFELKNGFRSMMYMNIDEMASYCKIYSPSMKNCKMSNKELAEMAERQLKQGPGKAIGWYGNFNEMATKTVLRRLLSKEGYLSIEMQNAFSVDEAPTVEEHRDAEFAEVKEIISVDTETGEVLNEGELQKMAAHEVLDGSEDDENKNPFES